MKKGIIVVVILGLLALIFYTQSGRESAEEYAAKIEEARVEKNEFMKTSSQSPFLGSDMAFEPLKFFAPNPEFKVRAKIEVIESKSFLTLGTSTGQDEKYLKYAYASFELKGTPMKLLLLKKATGKKGEPVFTSFADDTSGDSTYGGGRYLDLEFKNARRIDIDFNLAYNPYCAYNGNFSCPLPPAENILTVAIEAGEKTFH
ncbi:MAG: DUF1684 domain-containing protein [Cyclobacteriaceae bacterium]